MHLVLLGIMKKLLQFWVQGKMNVCFVAAWLDILNVAVGFPTERIL